MAMPRRRPADRVDEEEQQHGAAAADHHPRKRGADAQHVVGGAHQAEQLRPEQHADGADDRRHPDTEDDRLHRRERRALRILLADAPRDGGGRADREADGQRVDGHHQRLGEPHGGDGAGAEPADEERRRRRTPIHQHLEHHRHRQQHTPRGQSAP
jgi:hypothetical protein